MRLVGGQGSVLTVTLGWRENVRREPLRWIVSLQSPLFARVRIEEKNDRVKALHYSFAGSQDLQQMLSAPLQPVRYQLLLTALAEAEALRVQSRYLDYVLADPKLVFVSDGGVPCFAYVPIDNQRVVATMGFGRLLHALTDKKIRFQDPKDAAQRDLLAGFVASMGDEPDFAQFAAFLRDKMGYPLQATTRAVLEDLGLREAERARAREVGEADSDTGEFPEQAAGKAASSSNASSSSGKRSWRGVVQKGSYDAFLLDESGGHDRDLTDGTDGSVEAPPAMVPLAILRVSTGDVLSVPSEGGIVGRGSACAVRILGNPKVGREHAMLGRDEEGLVVSDLGSSNGTWFEGKPILGDQAVRLRVGQTFNVADEQLRVVRSDVFHA